MHACLASQLIEWLAIFCCPKQSLDWANITRAFRFWRCKLYGWRWRIHGLDETLWQSLEKYGFRVQKGNYILATKGSFGRGDRDKF